MRLVWFGSILLVLMGCTGDGSPAKPTPPETLQPLTESEPRYLAFQIFEGGPDPAIPFDRVMVYTPRAKIAAVVDDIITTIGVTGGPRAKLAFILGPI